MTLENHDLKFLCRLAPSGGREGRSCPFWCALWGSRAFLSGLQLWARHPPTILCFVPHKSKTSSYNWMKWSKMITTVGLLIDKRSSRSWLRQTAWLIPADSVKSCHSGIYRLGGCCTRTDINMCCCKFYIQWVLCNRTTLDMHSSCFLTKGSFSFKPDFETTDALGRSVNCTEAHCVLSVKFQPFIFFKLKVLTTHLFFKETYAKSSLPSVIIGEQKIFVAKTYFCYQWSKRTL